MSYSRHIFLSLVMILLGFVPASGKPLPLMRISVENTDTHVQTRAVRHFCDILAQKLHDRIEIRFFSDAALFRDQDVIRALGQGKVEMAVPGTWHVAKFEPNVGIFLMPVLYGRSPEDTYKVLDSRVGQTIDQMIESRLNLTVVGRWIDLGYAHLFSMSKPITRVEDISGMRIRVAGGRANLLRIKAMGGNPMAISWPDLPDYMAQGRVDAVLTSYETIRSARLWENGIRFVFEDREYFPQYIPLIRTSFWKKLPLDIRQIIAQTWEENTDQYRLQAAKAQEEAKRELVENGVRISVPTEDQIKSCRKIILKQQDQIAAQMHIDPTLIQEISKLID